MKSDDVLNMALNSVVSQGVPSTINSLLPIGILAGATFLIIKNWDKINPFSVNRSSGGGDYNDNFGNGSYVRNPDGSAVYFGSGNPMIFSGTDINPPPNPMQKLVNPKDEQGNLKNIIGYTSQGYPIYETVLRPEITNTIKSNTPPPLKIKEPNNSNSWSKKTVVDQTPLKTTITPQTSSITKLKSTSNTQTNSVLTPRASSTISNIFSLAPNAKPISLRL